jgi:hypothetical protein
MSYKCYCNTIAKEDLCHSTSLACRWVSSITMVVAFCLVLCCVGSLQAITSLGLDAVWRISWPWLLWWLMVPEGAGLAK